GSVGPERAAYLDGRCGRSCGPAGPYRALVGSKEHIEGGVAARSRAGRTRRLVSSSFEVWSVAGGDFLPVVVPIVGVVVAAPVVPLAGVVIVIGAVFVLLVAGGGGGVAVLVVAGARSLLVTLVVGGSEPVVVLVLGWAGRRRLEVVLLGGFFFLDLGGG